MSVKNLVTEPLKSYKEMALDWHLIDALWGGTKTMRLSGQTYLPLEEKESEAAWESRRKRTFLTNYFRYSCLGLVGKVFKNDVTVDSKNKSVIEWAENIDLLGNNLSVFAKNVFLDAVKYGASHVLADLPNVTGVTSAAGERQAGIRPYLVHVPIKNLIGWKYEIINGRPKLVQIRIKETYTAADQDNIYEDAVIEQIKVINIGTWEVWRSDNKANWIKIEEGTYSLDYIPLFTFYTNKNDFMVSSPPLNDLAYLNLRHWQSSSDQNNILHVARVPFLFAKGFSKDSMASLTIGVNRLLSNDNIDSSISYIEHSGAGIAASRQDLLDIEDSMRLMALSVIVQKSGQVTATEKIIDSSDATSLLKQWAMGLQDTLANAMIAMGDYANIGKEEVGYAKINTDFEVTSDDANDVNLLLQARMAGEISRDTLWSELTRRNILSADFDQKAETVKLESLPVTEAY